MASLYCSSATFLLISLFILTVSPSHSLTCTSPKLTKTYATCTKLSALGAYLHYTYDAANSSLSVAFLAPATNAWVAWAINPTGVGMVGAQALMALKPASGSIVAKTYNISSYHSIVESKLSFEVWDLSADESNGIVRLFGSVKVPSGGATLNQVWQVGSSVDGTSPKIHDMKPDNRNSVGTIKLVAAASAPAPTPSGGASGLTPAAAPGGFVSPADAPVASVTPAAAPVASVSPAPASGAPTRILKGGIVGTAGMVFMSLFLL